MPKEYIECVKSYKAKGKSTEDAKRICAIRYYKLHGKRPTHSALDAESAFLFDMIDLIHNLIGEKG